MESNSTYREIRFYQKREATLYSAILSLIKDGALLLIAWLTYRNSKRAIGKVFSLLAGGQAVTDAVTRVLVPKTLLLINEEGISLTPLSHSLI
jgi:hypothetical protein